MAITSYFLTFSSLKDLPGHIAPGILRVVRFYSSLCPYRFIDLQARRLNMPKQLLRQQMLAQRRILTLDEWRDSSLLAQNSLLSLQEYLAASCIALYAPIQNEIDTAQILAAALLTGKRVLYPALLGHEIVLRQVKEPACFKEGKFGIQEPCQDNFDYLADEPNLIVVPGVAFDLSGHRIGFGKGYYDRFLNNPMRSAKLTGLCHDFQVTAEAVPTEEHDIRMDIVVTEKRVIRCGSNRRHIIGPDSHRGGY